jgi:hypothetical protein
MIQKIIRLLDEAKGGLAGHDLSLSNDVADTREMSHVGKAMDGSGRRPRFIPIVLREGELAWPDKYVKTDSEALVANKDILNPCKRKISLKTERAELNAGGRRVYAVEMLLDPIAACPTTIVRLITAFTESR